jgi:hypothetical protein
MKSQQMLKMRLDSETLRNLIALMAEASSSRNWTAEVRVIQRIFPDRDLDKHDCDFVDLCKESRSVDEVIVYLRQNLFYGL